MKKLISLLSVFMLVFSLNAYADGHDDYDVRNHGKHMPEMKDISTRKGEDLKYRYSKHTDEIKNMKQQQEDMMIKPSEPKDLLFK